MRGKENVIDPPLAVDCGVCLKRSFHRPLSAPEVGKLI